jgi:hypothetical protein
MVEYRILNEGELFCTTLTFNLDDDKHTKLIGDPGNKDEDAVKAMNARIDEMIRKYRGKFDALKDAK